MSDETALQTRADNSDGEPREFLRVEGLSYKYGSFHALSEVSFSAGAGELIALVGRKRRRQVHPAALHRRLDARQRGRGADHGRGTGGE